MDLRSLRRDLIHDEAQVELIEGLARDFNTYAEVVRRAAVRQATADDIEQVRYPLDLRFTDSESLFREVQNAEEVLNAEIFGLVRRPYELLDFSTLPELDATVRRANAKLDHVLRKARESLKRTQRELASLEGPTPEVSREGAFLAGQTFDALRLIQKILEPATNSIDLIDGYVNVGILDLVAKKPTGVSVRILTKPSIDPAFVRTAKEFKRQYGGLSIRTSEAFHDRFLMIDDKDFYHFGASLKDVGKRGFMFSRIEEPTVMTAIRDEWVAEWSRAQDVV